MGYWDASVTEVCELVAAEVAALTEDAGAATLRLEVTTVTAKIE